jgi:hypothetical protein
MSQHYQYFTPFSKYFYYCCAGWRYTVVFIKVLTMYQIYHTWIHSLPYSLSSSIPSPWTVSSGIIFAFAYMCIHYLHHIHPPTPFPSLPPPPSQQCQHPPRQNLFCQSVLRFCRIKNIKDKEKNMAFLLVWDTESYTEKFFVLFPCIYVLQPQLLHLYQTSSLLPSPYL